MSKRIIFSIVSAVAMSIGGFFASCGSDPGSSGSIPVIVQLPEGCTLVSPRDELGSLGAGTPAASVKPGKNQFVISCGGRMIELDKEVGKDQHSISFTEDELR